MTKSLVKRMEWLILIDILQTEVVPLSLLASLLTKERLIQQQQKMPRIIEKTVINGIKISTSTSTIVSMQYSILHNLKCMYLYSSLSIDNKLILSRHMFYLHFWYYKRRNKSKTMFEIYKSNINEGLFGTIFLLKN